MEWIWAVLAFSAVILLHEAGHYLACVWQGIPVLRFSIGVGPTLWSRRFGLTEVRVGLVQLGGYVMPFDSSSAERFGKEEWAALKAAYPVLDDESRCLSNQNLRRRVVTLVAGPAANFLVVLAGMTAFYWTEKSFDQPGAVRVMSVEAGSLAERMDMRPQDEIVAVEDRVVRTLSDARLRLMLSLMDKESSASITVRRAGEELELRREVMLIDPLPERYGIQFAPHGIVENPSVSAALSRTTVWMSEQALFFWGVVSGEFSLKVLGQSLAGPIGMFKELSSSAAVGITALLISFYTLHMVVGLMNLLPLLPLDGGKIIQALGEALFHRKLSASAEVVLSLAGLLIMLSMATFGTIMDVKRLIG